MSTKMKKGEFIGSNLFRVLLVILGSFFSTVVLTFAVLAIIRIQEQNIYAAAGYIFAIFIVLGFSRLVTLIRERTKASLFRFICLFVFDALIGVLVFFGKDVPYLYSLMGGLFCVTLVLSRVFKIVADHSVRSIVLNSILILLLTLFAVGLFIPQKDIYTPLLFVCFLIVFTALIEVLSNAFSQLKLRTLFKIIIRTFALEIILGLLTMIVASSLIFMYFEEKITDFADGLWYSFAVVTTIGFGDYYAVTPIGRIVTVALGIYGIIVVAVITSIIVNFYNESTGKKDAKQLKQIGKENKEKK